MKTYILWMAWKQIVSKKGKSLSFMTVISILGVGIGVAALVVVLSVMGGFERDLKQKMFKGLPHLELMSKNAIAGFSLQDVSLKSIADIFPDAVGIEPFTQSDVVIKRKKHLASVTLFGIDPQKGGKLWGFSDGMINGDVLNLLSPVENSPPGIILGESLANQLGAEYGDEIQILNPQAGVHDALSGGKISSHFRVVGVFLTDLPKYDSKYAVVTLDRGRQFMPDYEPSLDEEEYVSGIAVNIEKPENIDQFLPRLSQFQELEALTWKTVNKSLLFALKLEKFTMGAIMLLIVLVAAFSISGTLMMTVYHKRSQVALLRAIGMEKIDIAKLFLAHGFTIGIVGVVVGLILGLGACLALYYFQFIDLPEGIYYQRKLPVKFLPYEYAVICLSAWFLSLGAALYPALVAAKQDPGTGLRYM